MAMSERQLRRFLHRRFQTLRLRAPFEPSTVCAALSADRARPIELRAEDNPELGAFGVLIPMPNADVIVYQAALPADHRNRIVFHEIVHLLREHAAGDTPGSALMCGNGLQDDAGDASSLYDAWQEWEAETGAAIVSEWNDVAAGAGSLNGDLSGSERAFAQALEEGP